MMWIKKIVRPYLNNQNWNIGFAETTPQELVENQKIGKVTWLKHPYKDRFFADPFVYKQNDTEIVVFVEELEFGRPVGFLTELVVDAKTKKLLRKYTLLKLDSHLSYPAIIRHNGEVLVCPENGTTGKLTMYRYDEEHHQLQEKSVIIEESLADATIYKQCDTYYMFATKVPKTQEDLFLYKSARLDGDYEEVGLISQGRKHSRPAGNLFTIGNTIYRPAQNCGKRYGTAVEIMKITTLNDCEYVESHCFSLIPTSFRYNLGLHTINFYEKGCVIDGYGYLYPIVGRVLHFVRKIVKSIIR